VVTRIARPGFARTGLAASASPQALVESPGVADVEAPFESAAAGYTLATLMTTLVSWFGRDSHGPASVYIAADSRITWPATSSSGRATWDRARKVFASNRHPEILGYCGDVLFPTQLLGQAVDLMDRGLLVDVTLPAPRKIRSLQAFIDTSLAAYTSRTSLGFELVYACRSLEGMSCEFSLYHLFFDAGRWRSVDQIELPERSALLLNVGSGAAAVSTAHGRWLASSSGGTSRGVFSAFHDALRSGVDPSSGGPPQLVGLYRVGPARIFGFVDETGRYVLGSEPGHIDNRSIGWYNATFERCDPRTRTRLPGAQQQPRPRDLPRNGPQRPSSG
jgi:hypothetical protein